MLESKVYDSNLFWLRNKNWRNKFLLHKSYPGLGSWLSEKTTGIGCKVCSAQCCKTPWGKHAVRSPSCCRLASSAFTNTRMVTSEQSRHIFSTSALLPHRSPLAHGVLPWTSSHDLLMNSSRGRLAVLDARQTYAILIGGWHQTQKTKSRGAKLMLSFSAEMK